MNESLSDKLTDLINGYGLETVLETMATIAADKARTERYESLNGKAWKEWTLVSLRLRLAAVEATEE